jgi:hypothetical protein
LQAVGGAPLKQERDMPRQLAENDDNERIHFSTILQGFLTNELSQHLPDGYADMMFTLWDEHRDFAGNPIAHPRALRTAVAGAKSVGGKDTPGGDIFLFDGRRREFKLYYPAHNPYEYKTFVEKLREKSKQRDVSEIFMQMGRMGCNTSRLRAMVRQFGTVI